MTIEISELLDQAVAGERAALARLLSKVERGEEAALTIQQLLNPLENSAHIIGVTGPPGAGKSSLINSLVPIARQHFSKVAVLVVDPSSPFSQGALLGDRVRMQGEALDESVFIRSMASRGDAGGLAKAAYSAVQLFAACGWPLIIIETLGIGQVELDVMHVADTVLVTLNPGWGDIFQANKAGITEAGDVFAINKCDRPGAQQTRNELEESLTLLDGEHVPAIVDTVATEKQGIDFLWQALMNHKKILDTGGTREVRRADKQAKLLRKLIINRFETRLDRALLMNEAEELLATIISGDIEHDEAIENLLSLTAKTK